MNIPMTPWPITPINPQPVVMVESCVPESRPRVPFADKRKERRYHRRCVRSLARGFTWVPADQKADAQAYHRKMARRTR